MKTCTQLVKEELRDDLFPLAESCPVEESNPDDCPLYFVRQMKPMQRLQWFNGLGEHGLAYLAAYHQTCLRAKLAAKLQSSIA